MRKRPTLFSVLVIILVVVMSYSDGLWAETATNNEQSTKQQPPASSSAPAPSEMDKKVHAAIRKAAELTEKTEEKVAPVIDKIKEKYQNFSNAAQKQFNDKIAIPVGNAIDAVKDKAAQYNKYFRQEFGLPEPKQETAIEHKTKQNSNPKSFLEELVGDTGDINAKQSEIMNNPAITGAAGDMQGVQQQQGGSNSHNMQNAGDSGYKTPTASQPNHSARKAPPPSGGHKGPPPRGGSKR